jgi:tyrosine-protein phosphatase YwqE
MGLFKKLFGSSGPDLGPADIGQLQVDLHSHLIPGIDDGSPDLESTMSLLERFKEFGYRKVVTSPHVMADGYKNTPEIILGGLEKVREEIQRVGLDMEIDAAAEYYLDHELENLVKAKNVLTFGGDNKYVLFELPFIGEPSVLLQVIFGMQTNGYKPVLAHPERYQFWHNSYERLEDLKDRGVLLQLNMIALSGAYGPGAKKIAERMIDDGFYEFIGSDCHNMNHIQAMQNTLHQPYLHKILDSGKLLNEQL